jgi:hypothetical protein
LLALRSYGPAAKNACLPLGAVVNEGGTEQRVLAFQVLGNIGKQPFQVLTYIVKVSSWPQEIALDRGKFHLLST